MAALSLSEPCVWLAWSNWSECSKSCDNGTKSRRRDFIPARYGGEPCIGALEEIQLCNTQDCPGRCAGCAVRQPASHNFTTYYSPFLPDPCKDNGHPCFKADIECTKLSDTEFKCGPCPNGMSGDGRNCTPVDEVRRWLLSPFSSSPSFSSSLSLSLSLPFLTVLLQLSCIILRISIHYTARICIPCIVVSSCHKLLLVQVQLFFSVTSRVKLLWSQNLIC